MEHVISLSKVSDIKGWMDFLYNTGGDIALKQYISRTLCSNISPYDKDAIIYIIKNIGLYPQHKNFVETLITFG